VAFDPHTRRQLEQLKEELSSGQSRLQITDSQNRPLPQPADAGLKHRLENKLRQLDAPSVARLAEALARLDNKTFTLNKSLDANDLNQVTDKALGQTNPDGAVLRYGHYAIKTQAPQKALGLATCTSISEWLVDADTLEERIVVHYPSEHFIDINTSSSGLGLLIEEDFFLTDGQQKLARWPVAQMIDLLKQQFEALLLFEAELSDGKVSYCQSAAYWELDEDALLQLFKEAHIHLRLAVKRRQDGKLRGGRPKQVQLRLSSVDCLNRLYKKKFSPLSEEESSSS
jgi:hypothetical protein